MPENAPPPCYLASREACVAVRTADYKLAGGVHKQFEVGVKKLFLAVGELLHEAGDEDVSYVVRDDVHHLIVGEELSLGSVGGWLYEVVVLRGEHDGVDAERTVVVVVFNRHLRFGVGAEVFHFVTFAADFGEGDEEFVREFDAVRHQALGLAYCVSKHHTLVACALIVGFCAFYATVDVLALSVYC